MLRAPKVGIFTRQQNLCHLREHWHTVVSYPAIYSWFYIGFEGLTTTDCHFYFLLAKFYLLGGCEVWRRQQGVKKILRYPFSVLSEPKVRFSEEHPDLCYLGEIWHKVVSYPPIYQWVDTIFEGLTTIKSHFYFLLDKFYPLGWC